MPVFDPGTVNMRVVVEKKTFGPVFLREYPSPLSIYSHQFSVLLFIYMLLLTEVQTEETWKPSKSNPVLEAGSIQ